MAATTESANLLTAPTSPSAKTPRKDKARTQARHKFLETHAPNATEVFLAGDCSPRRYFRVTVHKPLFEGQNTAVLMDAPPDQISLPPFLNIHAILTQQRLRVPHIYATDTLNGFMLLEDFGDASYKTLLSTASGDDTALFLPAIQTLCRLHRGDYTTALDLPMLDAERLTKELDVFWKWGPSALEYSLTKEEETQARITWESVLSPLDSELTENSTLVLRDFHAENLIQLPGKGIDSCGILDFQDALLGHPAYDLVSLLEDVRVPENPLRTQKLKTYYLIHARIDPAAFETAYHLLGLQRAVRIFGLFCRLIRQENMHHLKPYLERCKRFMAKGLALPEAALLRPFFRSPALQIEHDY